MEANDGMKFVEFERWCHKCVHYENKEDTKPCYECLDEPVNFRSHKPMYFEAKE